MNRSTALPRWRPRMYHNVSQIVAAIKAVATTIGRFIRPVPARAPAASSTGAEGIGNPACSPSTQKNKTEYPW